MGKDKFGTNEFHFRNKEGELTEWYLGQYIRTWCRVEDGFTYNREANLHYFDSAEFKRQHIGKTASQLGKAASLDPRWNRPANAPRAHAGGHSKVQTDGMEVIHGVVTYGGRITGQQAGVIANMGPDAVAQFNAQFAGMTDLSNEERAVLAKLIARKQLLDVMVTGAADDEPVAETPVVETKTEAPTEVKVETPVVEEPVVEAPVAKKGRKPRWNH